MDNSQHKVAIITGGGSGIGFGIAEKFVQHGIRVIIVGRDEQKLAAAKIKLGELCDSFVGDLSDLNAIPPLVTAIFDRYQRIDILVNNAGINMKKEFTEVTDEEFQKVLLTNVTAVFCLSREVVKKMLQQGSGSIINVSSVAGHIPLPFHAIYSATKFAMNALGKAANVELKPRGIHVMTVCPGYVRTSFAANALRGKEAKTVRPSSTRGITAERVAKAVLEGYLKQKREVVVPWTMHPMIKIYQLFPWLVEWAMMRMAKPRA